MVKFYLRVVNNFCANFLASVFQHASHGLGMLVSNVTRNQLLIGSFHSQI